MNGAPFRSGFCSIVGRPNVGKSTLLNAFVAAKLAIMSDKPQTTRNRILGVYNRPDAQVVFLDTPGIHKPRHRLGEYMNKVAIGTIPEVDVVLFVVDGSVPEPGEGDRYVADVVARSGRPAILVVNKMDRVKRGDWYAVMDAYKALAQPEARSENPDPGAPTIEWIDIVPVSALEHKNIDALLDLIVQQMEEGPKYYPEDMITDQPERFVIAEFIREKILQLTRDEVPHSVAVEVEELQRRPTGTVYVSASIYVERESQKGIIIGKRGAMLKEIGARARQDIEQMLGSKIYLELFVKVKEDWRNKESVLRSLGYREE
ncbi:GTPase Era [Symbiobacterium thermophilum]|uniref:GTPase Era n=2 Tax=Symbiobacterium thermophilum TaxID=2734 RepID=Q67S24_SYMTH|nr:GTPase Era [Symbiobacterium thermophilum]MBY6276328.1 GTPase Era [Symbiobacterium thermophilum]BAD39519.1 Era family GTP-binding protein [Symbiobacterium thermophilum IAM 14863]